MMVGWWTVVAEHHLDHRGRSWLCQCRCGTQRPVAENLLTGNRTTNCGCKPKYKHTQKGQLSHRSDLEGMTFWRWTVVMFAWIEPDPPRALWLCRCKCGRHGLVSSAMLRNGSSRSCGCSRLLTGPKKTHHDLYSTWQAMRQRCSNTRNPNYKYYGGKGVKVCRSWSRSFWAFVADMPPRPLGTSLDRIDPGGHYEPGNCRWADPQTQARNQVRHIGKDFSAKSKKRLKPPSKDRISLAPQQIREAAAGETR